MLTSEIKQRINNCRDILVGKLPDPKSQVIQITNALIYKFMDDQDRLSEKLGGKASFFTGTLKPYAWHHLFNSKLTNQERADLYIEGIQMIAKAKNLPELFREIFKEAYVPFRAANTVTLFIEEINKFDYNHSEELGNAYEYLLSIMGSQGDAGQFRTPRHIIDFIVGVVDPHKGDTIYDPACGTAGFLISAYKHILMSNGGKLNANDRRLLSENVMGVDISPDMAKMARVNLYLHGFSTPVISEGDPLSDENLWGTKFDVVLANPPFMTPKGGIEPHEKHPIKAKRSELLFTSFIAHHLKLKGRAGIVVPEGVLHNNTNASKTLRKLLLEQGLWAVVELPHGTFKPYASVKTHIIFIDRSKSDIKEILFIKIENDGYSQTDARKPVNGEQLTAAKKILTALREAKDYKTVIKKYNDVDSFTVSKERLLADEYYSLVGRRYKAINLAENSKWDVVSLDNDLIEVKKGLTPIEATDEGEFNFVVTAKERKTAPHFDFEGKAVCVPTVSSTGHGHASVRRVHFVDGKFALANIMAAIFVKRTDLLLPEFLFHMLDVHKEDVLASLMTGTSNVSLNPSDIYKIKIPLPPINIQREFVTESIRRQQAINKHLNDIELLEDQIKEKGFSFWG